MSFGNFIKQNFTLCVGLGLPIVLVLAFIAVSVIPKSLAIPPQHRLVYTKSSYNHAQKGHVSAAAQVDRNGHIYMHMTAAKGPVYETPQVFVYDPAQETTEQIAFTVPDSIRGKSEDVPLQGARHLKISPDATAPDGYRFEEARYYSAGLVMDIFGGNRSNAPRIVKGAVAYKIDTTGERYNHNIQFIGWVVDDNSKK